MKKVVTVQEVEGEGLQALLGKTVTLWCLNYIYYGTLVGVNDKDVLLENAGLVYETGELSSKTLKDLQKVPFPLYVRTSCIESYSEWHKQ